ncbi:hypothetical protein N9X37_04920 [Planktomarina temperata]|nr:hypothetical protein [Planktomarina temperata]
MQRFNRISAVICLLLSCAPRAYALDNRHGETMGAAVAKTKLAGVYRAGDYKGMTKFALAQREAR